MTFDAAAHFAYAGWMLNTPPCPKFRTAQLALAPRSVLAMLALAISVAGLPVPGCADIGGGQSTADAAAGNDSGGADSAAGASAFPDELYADPGECEDPGQWVRTMFVLDGDTIMLDDGYSSKVRLLGVAAPEIAHPPNPKPAECYGPDAWTLVKKWLVVEQFAADDPMKTSELQHMYVCVRPDPNADNKDDFGRLLRYVYLRDATGKAVQLNARLVRQGAARVYTSFAKGLRHESALKARQTTARNEGLGGWDKCKWSPR